MKPRRWLIVFASALALGQQPGPTSRDLVLHIDVNLVQVDAIVTDAHGRQVTDLKPEDFEILEDGKPQAITNLSYIRLAEPDVDRGAKNPKPGAELRGAPPAAPIARDQVKRTLVLVADDLGLSFESAIFVRRALKKFVDERMQPGDLVSVQRTSAGDGALQAFTSDRGQLYAAIDAVRWYSNGRAGIDASEPYASNPFLTGGNREARRPAPGAALNRQNERMEEEAYRQEVYAQGTLGALTYVIDGLKDMPGRKGVILFSDGVPIFLRGEEMSGTRELLRRVADLANRSSVVVNTVDARGLQYLGPTAADNFQTSADMAQFDAVMRHRRTDFLDAQQGLEFLAVQTGGRFIHDNNDLSWAVDRVIEDLNGYYLIGYKPRASTWEKDYSGPRFHRIHVEVLRRGLTVRSRTGFYGVPDEELRRKAKTPEESLTEALKSPFGASDIPVKLTSIFLSDGKNSRVLAMLHVDSRTMTFTPQPDGTVRADLDLLVTAHDQNGATIGKNEETALLLLKQEEWEDARVNGLLYSAAIQVEQPGAVRVRAAVRDVASGKMGATNDFLQVPDLQRGHLTIGGVALGRITAKVGLDTPAVRVFAPGAAVPYVFSVFNVKTGPHGTDGRIYTRLRVFHEGKEVFAGDETALSVSASAASRGGPKQNGKDRKAPPGFSAAGSFQLDKRSRGGEYYLEVIARDQNAGPKDRPASIWTDFAIAAAAQPTASVSRPSSTGPR